MKVRIKELQEGCILTKDVYSWTNRPIITKKTVLTGEMIEVLHAFLIKDVTVEKTLVNGMPFIPAELIEEDNPKIDNKNIKVVKGFIDLYLEAVKDYKREFLSWQAGLPIKIGPIREILLPLLDKLEESPSEIFYLHHLSNKEDYLYHHAVTVGLVCGFIGKKLNFPKGDWVQLSLAGCLADCGMAKINPTIINKKTALTASEYEEVKKHPIYSYRLVQEIQVLRQDTKVAILQHHERIDGSGYPLGDQNSKINTFAKIIAVADIFHAMTSERMYKSKQSPFKVLEMILQDSFGKFDMSVVKVLISALMNFSIGGKVKLSDGQTAEIVFIDGQNPTRPLIKLLETDDIIHLEKNRHLFIEEVLQ
ncbi:HD-GYP domain-containing protein [Bacillus sp. CGMCC 1.16607]|uniref:HD-GYP domain-containing protein n=1 Tax=Bacillus sp. CGMCC 1.16607 TaxID=3351842 RepID=UPI003632A696